MDACIDFHVHMLSHGGFVLHFTNNGYNFAIPCQSLYSRALPTAPFCRTSCSISITELENISQAQVFIGSSGFRLCFQFVLFLTPQVYPLENRATEFLTKFSFLFFKD